MRSTLQPHKPPFGLLNARAQAVRLDEVAAAYVRRRLERLRFNLDGAAPWVEVSIVQAREEDRKWLLAVASELAATSEHVYDLIKGRAFFGASWAQQASPILVSIDGMLSLYADAAADDYWGRR